MLAEIKGKEEKAMQNSTSREQAWPWMEEGAWSTFNHFYNKHVQ